MDSDQPISQVRRISAPTLVKNEHLAKLTELFGPFERSPRARIPNDISFVFVCFTNRSGSNFLSALLSSSGQFNRAGEILNWPGIKSIAERQSLVSFQEVFASLARRFQKRGVFFVKAALPHLDLLVRSGVLDHIIERSRFILTERGDKLGQAISFAIANATGSFTSEIEPVSAAVYSREIIERCVAILAAASRDFTSFFGRNGIVPTHVFYERLIADPEGETMQVARELGLPDFSVDLKKVRLTKQAGAINAEWRERYLARG